jgi:PAS domain S-box-containing protein
MKMLQPKRRAWVLTISLAGAVAVVLIWKGVAGGKPEDRVYRIGWDPDPPFQAIGANGQATGLAVELVREAARRCGIQLEWVRQAGGADAALRDRKVDLWPLLAIIPERNSYVHFTEPYLETEHCLLVRADSGYTKTKDLAGALIAHNGVRINERNLHLLLPDVRTLSSQGTGAAMENVCRRRADAAFVEEYVALSALLGGLSCSGQELRLIAVPEIRPHLGVGSTFAASAAADAIRAEMGEIAEEGKLPPTLSRWSYFSLRNLESIQALREAKREAWLVSGLATLLLGVLVIAAWLTSRTLRARKKARWAEKELGTTQQNYRLLTEQAADGVFLADRRGRFLLVNSRMGEMLGYTGEEMLQMTVLDTYFPDEREFGRMRLAGIASGTSARFERQMRRKDGTPILIEASVVRLGDGRMQEIVRDITERKQAELALRESEERFRNVADSAPVMIWVAGTDKVLTFFNKTWLDFVGRKLEQELNNGWVESVHPDDRERCFAGYCSAFDARENFQIEHRLRRADGGYRRVLCTGVPRLAPDGSFAGYIGSDIDITDLRRAQEEIFERQKLESLGVLTGGVAHDFNNLLGSILLDAEIAEADIEEGKPPEGQIRRIKAVAVRAAEIVRELMIYSGQDKADLEPVDLSRIVEEMLELLKVSISKHAVLKTDLHNTLPPVRGNAAQLRQIVMNLIINASEAIGENDGVIVVSTSLTADGQEPSAEGGAATACARLEVSDTGCGMSEEQRTRIFDPFFTTKFAGRGLGLAAVQGIVRSHGGTIHVVSAPGQGSRFAVLLPCISQPVAATVDGVVPALAGDMDSIVGTVLLVEDENALRLSVSKMLRRRGFTVIEAASGTDAVQQFRAAAPQIDVVLLDMTLPGMSGRNVLDELRQIRPNVKVIVTSAYSQDWTATTIGGQQPLPYIRKPYRFNELMVLLRNACLHERKMTGRAAV